MVVAIEMRVSSDCNQEATLGDRKFLKRGKTVGKKRSLEINERVKFEVLLYREDTLACSVHDLKRAEVSVQHKIELADDSLIYTYLKRMSPEHNK